MKENQKVRKMVVGHGQRIKDENRKATQFQWVIALTASRWKKENVWSRSENMAKLTHLSENSGRKKILQPTVK